MQRKGMSSRSRCSRSSAHSRQAQRGARRRGRTRRRRHRRRRRSRSAIVYSRTGLLAAYGAQYIQGLRSGSPTRRRARKRQRPQDRAHARRRRAATRRRRSSAAKDLIGKGYKIIAGSVSSGVALADRAAGRAEQGPLHLRPGRDRRHHRASTATRSAPAARPTRTCSTAQRSSAAPAGKNVVVFAQDTAFGRATSPPSSGHRRAGGHRVQPHPRAAVGAGLHAVRQQAKQANAGPALRRLGRHDRRPRCGARSTSRASSALDQDRHRARRAGDVGDVRAGRREDQLPVALRLDRRRRTRSTTSSSARCGSAARCRTSSRRTASSPAR